MPRRAIRHWRGRWIGWSECWLRLPTIRTSALRIWIQLSEIARISMTSGGAGGGVATAALALGLDHCFGSVMLHRVEATVRPENAASRAVLAKVGFREEGLLRRYLEVDRAWRDHLLVAITVDEVHGSVASALVRAGHASWP